MAWDSHMVQHFAWIFSLDSLNLKLTVLMCFCAFFSVWSLSVMRAFVCFAQIKLHLQWDARKAVNLYSVVHILSKKPIFFAPDTHPKPEPCTELCVMCCGITITQVKCLLILVAILFPGIALWGHILLCPNHSHNVEWHTRSANIRVLLTGEEQKWQINKCGLSGIFVFFDNIWRRYISLTSPSIKESFGVRLLYCNLTRSSCNSCDCNHMIYRLRLVASAKSGRIASWMKSMDETCYALNIRSRISVLHIGDKSIDPSVIVVSPRKGFPCGFRAV